MVEPTLAQPRWLHPRQGDGQDPGFLDPQEIGASMKVVGRGASQTAQW